MFDLNTSQKHTQQNFLNVNSQDLTNMFNINIGQTLTQQNFLREKPLRHITEANNNKITTQHKTRTNKKNLKSEEQFYL